MNMSFSLNDNEKLQNLINEIKFPRNFKKKLSEIYFAEFDDKFDQILSKKDTEFMNIYLRRVSSILIDMYSNDCLENEDLAILMKANEIEIYEKHFKPQFKLLKEALNSYSSAIHTPETNEFSSRKLDYFYDDDTMNIRDIDLNEERDEIKLLKENVSTELSFRKHCRFIDDIPRHFCQNGNASNFIKLRSIKNKGNTTHIICADCKLSYKSNCVLLFCNFCSLSFYSSISDNRIETPYLQPATWEKYHCSMIVNDQMRCIKCKDILFFDLKENLLKCFNQSCLFESDPYSIFWVCVTCKKEFQTNAKIYNPLEYKLVRSSIKEALISKKPARPNNLPCCQDKIFVEDLTFHHKKECNGRIFLGSMQNRKIIVCEKCRSLSNYDKFIWTCPLCIKRFKNKIPDINYIPDEINKERNDINNRDQKSLISELDHTPIQSNKIKFSSTNNTFNKLELDGNSTPLSENTKERAGDSINISNGDSLSPNSDINNATDTHSIRSQSSLETNSNKVQLLNFNNSSKEILETKYKISSLSSENCTGNNSLKTISCSSVRKENEKGNDFECDEGENFVPTRSSGKNKSGSSTTKLVSIKEETLSSSYSKIVRFKHSNTIKYYDNEIESNPVNKRSSNYKFNQSGKDEFAEPKTSENNSLVSKFNDGENIQSKTFNPSETTSQCTNDDAENANGNQNLNFTSSKHSKIFSTHLECEFNKTMIDYTNRSFGFDKFEIDDFTIDSLIGEGAHGKIYKIYDKNKNYFALKKNIIHDNKEIQTIMKQYIIMHKLRHPNILNLKGISLQKLDSTTTSIYVQMELATIDWIEDIKTRGKANPKKLYSEVELLSILKQVTAALAYMQKMNVAHRDLKPHNILIFEKFIYKIADFGETKFFQENPLNSENSKNVDENEGVRGTELFMSPILFQALKEFKSEKEIVHNIYKSDCFSLGLCIMCAASLSLDVLYDIRKIGWNYKIDNNIDLDFDKENMLLFHILTKEFNELKIYSKRFEAFIYKMLNINESERPDFIELERILQSQ